MAKTSGMDLRVLVNSITVLGAEAGACVAALRATGYSQAAIIGPVDALADALEPVVLA